MSLTISIADLRASNVGRLDTRIADLTAHLGRVPGEDEAISVETWWALPSTSLDYALWSLCTARPQEEARIMAVRVAVACAHAVAHCLPDNKHDQCALTLARIEAWLREPTLEKRAEVMAAFEAVTAAVKATPLDRLCSAAAVRAVRSAAATVCASSMVRALDYVDSAWTAVTVITVSDARAEEVVRAVLFPSALS